MEPGGRGPAIVDGDADQDVVGACLGVLEEHVEVAVVVEDARVEQLVFDLLPRPSAVRLHEVSIRELPLRILVEVRHVRVRGRRIEVEIVLLDVLAVVPLAVGEPEESLLQDGVALIPEGEGEAEALLVVRDPPETVLAPAIGAGAGLIVAEVVPRVAVLAVVLAHRAPLSLAQVGSPFFPGDPGLPGVVQPLLFRDVVGMDGFDRFGCLLASIPVGVSGRPARLSTRHVSLPRQGWYGYE